MKKIRQQRFLRAESKAGSAMIMTVVITVLLGAMGILFVMSARVDKIATSYITENRELNAAVNAVIGEINRQLVEDVPGVTGQEYFDYPGNDDRWLASLEPSDPCNPYWTHITDLNDVLSLKGWDTSKVLVEIVNDNAVIELADPADEYSNLLEQLADADGDGVGDSKWMRLENVITSKGKPIFAAVRIVDNGGMLNVNTSYDFDPGGKADEVDGSNQMQIDLFALSKRGSGNSLDDLNDVRFGPVPHNQDDYLRDVVWHYYESDGLYTPFDISDELKLRYRNILNYRPIVARIEEFWSDVYDGGAEVPRTSEDDWFRYAGYKDPNRYDYRHISTTYNMDRIIQPNGRSKMVNLNEADTRELYNLLVEVVGDANDAAQTAVNLADFRDSDSEVTIFDPGDPNDPNLPSGEVYYGFEGPCVYISELAHHFIRPGVGTLPMNYYYGSYAIELHKPYTTDSYPEPNGWRLNIAGSSYSTNPIPVEWTGTQSFHVMMFEDPCAPPPPVVFDLNDVDPCFSPVEDLRTILTSEKVFSGSDRIELQRRVDEVNDIWITVDSKVVPNRDSDSGWLTNSVEGVTRSIQRDIIRHKCIKRLWASAGGAGEPNLGRGNSYSGGGEKIQAHPVNENFTNVGQIGLVFRKGAYYEDVAERGERIGYSLSLNEEAEVRVDLTDPAYQKIFNYLTRLDPSNDGINNDDDGKTMSNPQGLIDEDDEPDDTPEWKIPGRININTAPWFVIAQLPWMKCTADTVDYNYDDPNQFERARAICDYRDKGGVYEERVGDEGFRNIGQLMNVDEMRSFGGDSADNSNNDSPKGPDLTSDSAQDDFEERDLLFTRVSDLVTVRSDVFTAYILVRIGKNGPQKRVVAILDRSGVYSTESGDVEGKVKIIARQPVADPR